MSSINGPQQKAMAARAETVQKQREQLKPTVTTQADGSQTIKAEGHVRLAPDDNQIRQSEISTKSKTGSLADKAFQETIKRPLDEGTISQQTYDDLMQLVEKGSLSRQAATYLASQVDALGGDGMLNLALDRCKENPDQFAADFEAGKVYQHASEDFDRRYYPNREDAAPAPEDLPPKKEIDEVFQRPLEEGIISQQTQDDLRQMVENGSLSPEAATYLASQVDALGGDVMVNIALDLCKENPDQFEATFQAGNLYQTLADEHHRRYYPAE